MKNFEFKNKNSNKSLTKLVTFGSSIVMLAALGANSANAISESNGGGSAVYYYNSKEDHPPLDINITDQGIRYHSGIEPFDIGLRPEDLDINPATYPDVSAELTQNRCVIYRKTNKRTYFDSMDWRFGGAPSYYRPGGVPLNWDNENEISRPLYLTTEHYLPGNDQPVLLNKPILKRINKGNKNKYGILSAKQAYELTIRNSSDNDVSFNVVLDSPGIEPFINETINIEGGLGWNNGMNEDYRYVILSANIRQPKWDLFRDQYDMDPTNDEDRMWIEERLKLNVYPEYKPELSTIYNKLGWVTLSVYADGELLYRRSIANKIADQCDVNNIGNKLAGQRASDSLPSKKTNKKEYLY